jgi:hypothetical protein
VQLGLALELVGVQVHYVHHGLPGQQEPGGALVLQVEGAVLVRRVLRACLLCRCGVKWCAVKSESERKSCYNTDDSSHSTKQRFKTSKH